MDFYRMIKEYPIIAENVQHVLTHPYNKMSGFITRMAKKDSESPAINEVSKLRLKY